MPNFKPEDAASYDPAPCNNPLPEGTHLVAALYGLFLELRSGMPQLTPERFAALCPAHVDRQRLLEACRVATSLRMMFRHDSRLQPSCGAPPFRQVRAPGVRPISCRLDLMTPGPNLGASLSL